MFWSSDKVIVYKSQSCVPRPSFRVTILESVCTSIRVRGYTGHGSRRYIYIWMSISSPVSSSSCVNDVRVCKIHRISGSAALIRTDKGHICI